MGNHPHPPSFLLPPPPLLFTLHHLSCSTKAELIKSEERSGDERSSGGTGGDGGEKQLEKLPLLRQPIQLASSFGDERRRPIESLSLSLGNNLPANETVV